MRPSMDKRRQGAEAICEALRNAGHRALLAGGCVRDHILGVEPHDYDVATDARPEEVEALFERCIGVGEAFGIQLVVRPEGSFEVATFRRDGPYHDGRHPEYVEYVEERQDALRRDFTINAMFLDPATGEIIDYTGGREDLRQGVLRAVGEPRARFEEDHLRLLRAVRFASRLGYAIDPATEEALIEMAPLIKKTSPERVRDELIKMLTEGAPRRAFELLDKTGLLKHVLPEVAQMKGIEQPPEFHPEGDVFEHTLLMLEMMSDAPSPTFAMAVLLHDVGKPPTQSLPPAESPDDRIRFNRHAKVGARMTEKIGRRLHMPNEEIRRITWMVENHMRVAAIPEMRESKRKRFVREEAFLDLLEVCRLDCVASHHDISGIEWIERYLETLEPKTLRPAPLLSGSGLIAMGYAPGPLFTTILSAIEDHQLEGTLTSPEDARDFVRRQWPLADSDYQ